MSLEVCFYYNVGYFKEKEACTKIHSTEDCKNKCKEKILHTGDKVSLDQCR